MNTLDVLRRLEWSSTDDIMCCHDTCPMCGRTNMEGHNAVCSLDAAIKREEGRAAEAAVVEAAMRGSDLELRAACRALRAKREGR